MNSVFVEEDNFEKARKKIRENKGREIIFSSNDDETARKVLEKEEISILLIKMAKRKDRQKQRNSGIDSVMAKLAKKKNIAVGIDYDEIINSQGKEKAEIIGRLKQNIRICNKEKLKMKFIAKNRINEHDLKAIGLALGMPTWMIKSL
ncbi:MAG TPA: RNase P subunit p30 family protein [Candidatus Omnitrophota bacterium]|nr:RNase P subunit p30 family protein [Candidatus Omnitrophota bacterium]